MNHSILRTLFVFIGLGPAIGALTSALLGFLYGIWEGKNFTPDKWLFIILFFLLPYGYAVGVLPAALAGTTAYGIRNLSPVLQGWIMAFAGLAVGIVLPLTLRVLFNDPAEKDLVVKIFIAFVISAFVATLACWFIVSRGRLAEA